MAGKCERRLREDEKEKSVESLLRSILFIPICAALFGIRYHQILLHAANILLLRDTNKKGTDTQPCIGERTRAIQGKNESGQKTFLISADPLVCLFLCSFDSCRLFDLNFI